MWPIVMVSALGHTILRLSAERIPSGREKAGGSYVFFTCQGGGRLCAHELCLALKLRRVSVTPVVAGSPVHDEWIKGGSNQ
jgi:hypothetical protein